MKSSVFAVLFFFALSGLCAGADQGTAAGTYISKRDSKEYLTLQPDGSFFLKQRKMPPDMEHPFMEVSGKYTLKGEELKLILPDGGEASGKLVDNIFQDSEGIEWVKQGSQRFELKRPTGSTLPKRLY